MSTSKTLPAADIDLATLGHALWRAKRWILGLTLLAGAITFIGLSMMRPLYTSEARILVQNEDSAFTRPTGEDGRNGYRTPLDEQAVQSQVQVLTSRDLILQVVKDLDLVHNATFQRDAGQTFLRRLLDAIGIGSKRQSAQERAANALADNLDVFQLSKSSVIAVEYSSGDPKLAAEIANKLADVYIGWQRTAKIEQTKDATAWLADQIKALRKATTESEEAVEKFKASKGLYAGAGNVTLNAQQLSELNSQAILSEAQESEARARAKLIKQMLADNGDINATPEVLKSQLIINLIEQRVEVQRQLAELSATLLPSHPRIQQLRSELTDVRTQIRNEAGKVVKSLENEAQVAAAREASLRASLNAAKSKSAGQSDAEIRLRALEREAKANRDLLESYLARYRDASARHDMGAVPAQAAIVSRAHASVLPSFPKKVPLSLLVMAATALLAVGYTLASELIQGAPAQEYVPAPQAKPSRRAKRKRSAAAKASANAPEPRQAATAGSSIPEVRRRKPARTTTATPAASVAPERKLPMVIAASPSATPKTDETASTPPRWQAKKPAKRPSWLKINEKQGQEPTSQAAPQPVPEPTPRPVQASTPQAAIEPEPKAQPAPEPKPEPAVEATPQTALEPEPQRRPEPVPRDDEAPVTGLLDRLRKEYVQRAGDKPKRTQPARRKSALFDRLRQARPKKKETAPLSNPPSQGNDMASLSPNDLRHYLTQRITTTEPDLLDAMPRTRKAGGQAAGPVLQSLDTVLDKVLERATGGLPRALLVAGTSPKADATDAAIHLARALVDRNEQVVLVDLTKGGSAVSGPLGMPRVPGFTDLAAGRAQFADVIRVDDDSPLQVITAGNPTTRGPDPEPDSFMRVFEALTQAYGCVVLHADLIAIEALKPALKFELPAMVAVLPARGTVADEGDALSTFQSLGCPVFIYDGKGKSRRSGLLGRIAAV